MNARSTSFIRVFDFDIEALPPLISLAKTKATVLWRGDRDLFVIICYFLLIQMNETPMFNNFKHLHVYILTNAR